MAGSLGAARSKLSALLSSTQKTVKPLADAAEKEVVTRYNKLMEANKQYVVKDEAKASTLLKQWYYTKLSRWAAARLHLGNLGHCPPRFAARALLPGLALHITDVLRYILLGFA